MIVNSSLDWLTLTKSWQLGEVEDKFRGGVTPLRRMFDGLRLTSKVWWGMGYRGEVCTETKIKYANRIRSGKFMDEMLVAPGKQSGLVANQLPREHSLKCTRLDLQVTAYLIFADTDVAERLYDTIRASEIRGVSIAGRRKASLIRSGTGATLYVGKRSGGGKFFRLYDKSFDFQSPLGMVWRQEVQYGRRYAENALAWYIGEERSQTEMIEMVVKEYLDAMQHSLVGVEDFDGELIHEVERAGGDIQAKLDWLGSSVRPVVQFLIDNEHGPETLKALGL